MLHFVGQRSADLGQYRGGGHSSGCSQEN